MGRHFETAASCGSSSSESSVLSLPSTISGRPSSAWSTCLYFSRSDCTCVEISPSESLSLHECKRGIAASSLSLSSPMVVSLGGSLSVVDEPWTEAVSNQRSKGAVSAPPVRIGSVAAGSQSAASPGRSTTSGLPAPTTSSTTGPSAPGGGWARSHSAPSRVARRPSRTSRSITQAPLCTPSAMKQARNASFRCP